MKSSQEWRDTAVRLRARSDKSERKAEALEHALNLLLNNGLIVFHTDMAQDGTIHNFPFGVASDAPIDGPFRRMLSGSNTQDFPVVLWQTKLNRTATRARTNRVNSSNLQRRRTSSRSCNVFSKPRHRP